MYGAGTGCAGATIYRDVMTAIVPDNCSAFLPSMAVYGAGTGSMARQDEILPSALFVDLC